MIRIHPRPLSAEALAELEELQREIDALPSYAERVRASVERWESRRQRAVFSQVRELLGQMCSGPKRCMFCEDSGAHQIEHFRPKSLYPGLVFAWANYLFACAQCNRSKSDRFAILSSSGTVIEIRRPTSEPPAGPCVPIDPREDDPMDYLRLDLRGTFRFKPTHPPGTPGYSRADYTINWLELNEREELLRARGVAYRCYSALLSRYVAGKREGGTQEELSQIQGTIRDMSHVTVWREMQRQSQAIGELRVLFEEVPEALAW